MELQHGPVVGAELDASAPSDLRRLQHKRAPSLQSRQLSFDGSGSYEFNMLRYAWTLHFVLSLFILFAGCNNNGESKYIIGKSPDGTEDCQKAFINVLASSAEIPDAIICRPNPPSYAHIDMPGYLPFAGRLARFPDALLLPLFPLFIRLIVTVYQYAICKPNVEDFRTTFKRILLYIFLMSIRMFVLYFLFNRIEHSVVQRPTEAEKCWYNGWLNDRQPNCYGRDFDFSDHIVLYFAQILPIALTEVLHSFTIPFWFKQSAPSLSVPQSRRCKKEPIHYVALALLFGLAYLYFITLLGTYKTAAHFHTASEIWIGMMISLSIQIPLCFLQCSTKWGCAREFFFGYPR